MRMTYIYSLKDPVTNEIRYIGKANRPEKRYLRHIRENSRSYKCNWIKSLQGIGHQPVLEIVDKVPINEWEYWESYYIELFKTWGFNLTNIGEGGLGGPGFKGKTHTDITKNTIRSKIKGKQNPSSSQPGVLNGRCKVSEDDVREMRRLYKEGNITYSKLAEIYSMNRKSIESIIKFKRFRNI